tara:strand:- start:376 stop:1098 length:723 start_codon:yes stop_codon:yes gene_type:complete
MKIVITQPMYFPWYGMLEQLNLADVLVYYDDVQFSKGGFTNRVQIKSNTNNGISWLTVPVAKPKSGTYIKEIMIGTDSSWKNEHLRSFSNNYSEAPYFLDAFALLKETCEINSESLNEIIIHSMESVRNYLGIETENTIRSSDLDICGRSSQRVFDIVKYFGCDTYITGHGAINYLDHELFEKNNISVEYLDYSKNVYPQQLGDFNPYVSSLDLIANVGQQGFRHLNSKTTYWRDFIKAN